MKTANTADSWCAPWKLPILWTVGVHYGNCQYCGQPYFAGAAILKDFLSATKTWVGQV
jgi:hypothetical protein